MSTRRGLTVDTKRLESKPPVTPTGDQLDDADSAPVRLERFRGVIYSVLPCPGTVSGILGDNASTAA
jgi:hypothetical protein